jgi:hypothetical protein
MTSMRPISVQTPVLQGGRRADRMIATIRTNRHRQCKELPLVMGSVSESSACPMLEAQLSASLRQSLIEQMAPIKSEDEAAAGRTKIFLPRTR